MIFKFLDYVDEKFLKLAYKLFKNLDINFSDLNFIIKTIYNVKKKINKLYGKKNKRNVFI